jgi:hypothetical protein
MLVPLPLAASRAFINYRSGTMHEIGALGSPQCSCCAHAYPLHFPYLYVLVCFVRHGAMLRLGAATGSRAS